MEIKAGNKDKSKIVTVQVNFPADLDAAIEAWGAEACFTLLSRQASTDVQNLVRVAVLNKGVTEQEAQKIADDYVPGARRAGVSRKRSIETYTREQLLARLAELDAE